MALFKKDIFSFRSPVFWKVLTVVLLLLLGWLIYLDAQIRYKFEGQRWTMPAQVFARALEIYDGKVLNRHNLEQELILLNYRKVNQVTESGQYRLTNTAIELFIRSHQRTEGTQTARHLRFQLNEDTVTDLQDLSGTPQAIYYLEPYKIGGIYPHVKEERQLLSDEQFPEALKTTLLATEDRDFYDHAGISFTGIVRAMWVNFRAGRVVQGGSTLTQQLVKNFFLSSERSLIRKINEAMMAILLEVHYSKTVILETYMNDIFLGQAGKLAIHGFEAASNFYFGKRLAECDLPELALLVAMVKGPSYYNPRRYPERARERRDLVLSLLHEQGHISESMLLRAQKQPVNIVRKPLMSTNRYPAFMDLVKRQLSTNYLEEDLREEGLKIYTTLDPQLQYRLEQSVRDQMSQLSAGHPDIELQTAAIVTAVGSGEVLAMQGDKNPQFQGFNRALDAIRPIGSLIKPAIYLTALAQPERYHLASLLKDSAFKLEYDDGTLWQPENFDKKEHGSVLLIDSLSHSYNLASARLGLDLGITATHDTLARLGVKTALNTYPSLFLGAQSLSPYEVSQMYLTMANQGFNIPLRAIREVTTAEGEVLSRYPFEVEQVVPPEAVFLLQHGLQAVMRSGTGKSAYQGLPASLDVAGKTGTTNDNRDSWFAGFSGDYLNVVWLGNDSNKPTSLTGSTGALRIWTDFMKRVPQHSVAMVQGEEISYDWFDTATGYRTDEHCQGSIRLPFWKPAGSIPYQSCKKGYSSMKGWIKSWF
jgi:penicillin-binding protein 1B